jgi:hypothetical protein
MTAEIRRGRTRDLPLPFGMYLGRAVVMPAALRAGRLLLVLALASTGCDGNNKSGTGASCAGSLAVGCKANNFADCPPTWDAANSFCVMHAGGYGFAQSDCGTYLRFHVENIDVGCSYYYEKTTGHLVAVFCDGYMGDTTCLGGPLGFTEPACGPVVYAPCAPLDAGVGAGDGGRAD